MDPITRMVAAGAAGAAGGEAATYVDDVFSTFLYEASGTTQAINNGIDLAGEGGMVWIKNRLNGGSFTNHTIVDSERIGSYGYKSIYPNLAEAEFSPGADSNAVVTSFNSNGFTRGGNANVSNGDNVSWTFRKAPGFFDVVTYTGNGSSSGQTISHNLDSIPGMIIIKRTNAAEAWAVFHRSTGNNYHMRLQSNVAGYAQNKITGGSATSFQVMDADGMINGNGDSYVAYLFAHDDARFGENSDESIIKCGSYTGTGGSVDINVGFETQWVLIKNITSSSDQYGNADWTLYDMMRPFNVNSSRKLHPNTNASDTSGGRVFPTATGFAIDNESNIDFNASGDTYIYMAIRRPHKPPEAATDVFGISSRFTGDNSATRAITTGGVTADLIITKMTSSSTYNATCWTDRIRGGLSLGISSQQGDMNSYWSNLSGWHDLAVMDGYKIGGTSYTYSNRSGYQFISFGIKRAPGFFDIVHYTGTGSATTIAHNLNATPSVVLIKGTDTTYSWYWQHYALGANTFMQINDESQATNGQLFNTTLPTSSVFSVGSLGGVNQSTKKYIAYLFADLDGISKAGTYSGTGNSIDVDCGFTAGARFVVIKRVDGSPGFTGQGDWYVWDSVRGIAGGNDPYSLLNKTDAEVTNTDYIDPLNAGFTVNSSAPADLNASGGTYLFLAIA